MEITLLGSGDAVGIPVPLCECEYCTASHRRRRPSLLVETSDTALLFDASPDMAGQLRAAGVTDLDAVFLTHAHYDHSDGLHALTQAGKWPPNHLEASEAFEPADDAVAPVYASATAHQRLRNTRHYLIPMLDARTITPRTTEMVGDFQIYPFAVEHARPAFETLGFAITQGETTVAYAPDVEHFCTAGPISDVDVLVVEGAALFGAPLHGPETPLRETIESVAATNVVLVNLSEHKARMHTADLANTVDYNLGRDFMTISL